LQVHVVIRLSSSADSSKGTVKEVTRAEKKKGDSGERPKFKITLRKEKMVSGSSDDLTSTQAVPFRPVLKARKTNFRAKGGNLF